MSNLIFSCDIWVCLKKGSVPQVYRNFYRGTWWSISWFGGILFLTNSFVDTLGDSSFSFCLGYIKGDLLETLLVVNITFSFCPWRNFVSPTGRCPSDPYFLLGSMGESTGSLWVKSERWAFLFITVGSICYIYTYKYIYIYIHIFYMLTLVGVYQYIYIYVTYPHHSYVLVCVSRSAQ